MRFEFAVGNPPYQEESEVCSKNKQKPMRNIFHKFQLQSDDIVSIGSVLIYPGARWIHRYGKGDGFKKFGKDLIQSIHLSTIEYFPHVKDLFANVDISDGITIVVKCCNKAAYGFDYIYCCGDSKNTVRIERETIGDDLLPLNPNDFAIINKIKAFVSRNGLRFLHDSILSRNWYGIESDFVEKNPDKVRLLEPSSEIDYSSEIKLLANDKSGKSGRSRWYITNRETITTHSEYIDEFQVVVSSANAGGQKRDNQLEIIDNHSAYGRSRVGLASFKTYIEAANFYTYVQSYFVRYAFLMTDEALSSVGMLVPDIMDYTANNGYIDFNSDIDTQLYRMVGLTADEVVYLKNVVDTWRRRG